MTSWIQGVDISVYQGAVDRAAWKRMREDGQRLAVVGSWHGLSRNPYCADNLERAVAERLAVATYVALNSGSGRHAVEEGRLACGKMWGELSFVAIDCEIDGITRSIIQEALDAVRDLGQKSCLYTAYWWWHGKFGNPQDFRHVPLWNAYYDQSPDIDFPTLPYGGWTQDQLIGEQYAGSVPYQGVTVDRNVFREDFVFPKQDREEQEPMVRVIWDGTFTWLVIPDRGSGVGLVRRYIRRGSTVRRYQDLGIWPDTVTWTKGKIEAIPRAQPDL